MLPAMILGIFFNSLVICRTLNVSTTLVSLKGYLSGVVGVLPEFQRPNCEYKIFIQLKLFSADEIHKWRKKQTNKQKIYIDLLIVKTMETYTRYWISQSSLVRFRRELSAMQCSSPFSLPVNQHTHLGIC